MQLNDKVQFYGHFSIKSYNIDGTFEEYVEKNLIMDFARTNMAQLIGGVNTGGAAGEPISKIVIGTSGHVGTDVLNNKQVGNDGFLSSRTQLFSNEVGTANTGLNYSIPFNAVGGSDVTVYGTGTLYTGATVENVDNLVPNTIRRLVTDRTVTYTITIPAQNGNSINPLAPVIAYTEAALYATNGIFAMKTFPARVKESTVRLEISWSIIF